MNRKWIKCFFLTALILFLLRLPTLIYPVMDVDESIYGLFARIWFDGGIPYLNCVETKPLGIYFFYGLIFSVFGKFNMIAIHAATIVVVGITAYVIYLISSKLYSQKAGFFAALLFIVFGTTYIPKYIATTIEPIMLLPVALQFYFWLRFEREKKGWLAVFSGFVFSVACLFKYQAGMNLFVMILYLGFVKPLLFRNVPYRQHWQGFFKFLLGAAFPPLVMLLYLANSGALDAFLFWNVQGNAQYISEGSSSISLARQLLARVLPYIASTVLLWVLAVACIISLLKKIWIARFCANGIDNVQIWLIVLWFILSFMPVSMGHRFYGHYFILLLPPMSILASCVLEKIWSASGKRLLKATVIFWIVLPAIGFTVARFFISDINRASGEDNLENYRPLAAYVSEHTKPDDRIVAWGFAPLIYWYSERLPGTRFFWSDLLAGRVPGLKETSSEIKTMPEAWDMFMEDLNRYQPAYIIDTAPTGFHDYENYPIERYPGLVEYIHKNYSEETRISGAVFYKRINR